MSQNTDHQKTLPEICTDFFSLVIQIRVTKEYGDQDSLLKKIKLVFDSIDLNAKKNDIPTEDVQDAKYALCGLFDQLVLTSDCPFKDEWSARPLELEFFGKNIAGIEFFNKLDEIRSQIENRAGVAEVYYYCLIHGFEGKYRIEGGEKLNLLVDRLASDLKRLNKGAYDKLSVQWELPQSLMQRVTTLIPPWIFGVVASFIVFIIFIVLKSMVGSESATLISELKGILSKL